MSDVLKGLTSIPKELEPEAVAKLFFQLSTEEKNDNLWEEILTDNWFDVLKDKEGNIAKRNARGAAKNSWRMLTDGRKFTFEKIASESENEKKYLFTYSKDGATKPGLPLIVKKERGEWRVNSAQLF